MGNGAGWEPGRKLAAQPLLRSFQLSLETQDPQVAHPRPRFILRPRNPRCSSFLGPSQGPRTERGAGAGMAGTGALCAHASVICSLGGVQHPPRTQLGGGGPAVPPREGNSPRRLPGREGADCREGCVGAGGALTGLGFKKPRPSPRANPNCTECGSVPQTLQCSQRLCARPQPRPGTPGCLAADSCLSSMKPKFLQLDLKFAPLFSPPSFVNI